MKKKAKNVKPIEEKKVHHLLMEEPTIDTLNMSPEDFLDLKIKELQDSGIDQNSLISLQHLFET